MASDQIEYCGKCQFYAKCRKQAEQGRLEKCKINNDKKGN